MTAWLPGGCRRQNVLLAASLSLATVQIRKWGILYGHRKSASRQWGVRLTREKFRETPRKKKFLSGNGVGKPAYRMPDYSWSARPGALPADRARDGTRRGRATAEFLRQAFTPFNALDTLLSRDCSSEGHLASSTALSQMWKEFARLVRENTETAALHSLLSTQMEL